MAQPRLKTIWRFSKRDASVELEDSSFEFSRLLDDGRSQLLTNIGPFLLRLDVRSGKLEGSLDVRSMWADSSADGAVLFRNRFGFGARLLALESNPIVWWPIGAKPLRLGEFRSGRACAGERDVLIVEPGKLHIVSPRGTDVDRKQLQVAELGAGGMVPRLEDDLLVLDTYEREHRELIGLDVATGRIQWHTAIGKLAPEWLKSNDGKYEVVNRMGELLFALEPRSGQLTQLPIEGMGAATETGLVEGDSLYVPLSLAGRDDAWSLGVFALPSGRPLARIPLKSKWPEAVIRLDRNRLLLSGVGLEIVDLKRGTASDLLATKAIARTASVIGGRLAVLPQQDELVCVELPK